MELPRNRTVLLTSASLLSLVLLMLHTADDIARGYEKGGPFNLGLIPIVVTVLYGALVVEELEGAVVSRHSGRGELLPRTPLPTLRPGNVGGIPARRGAARIELRS